MSVGDERMTEAAGGVIERELRIDAPPEIVFGFFTDPDRMARWMGRTIMMDPSPGGAYRIDYNGSDVASGTFVEVDEPHRIAFTWGWEAPGDPVPPGGSLVEVTLDGRRCRDRAAPPPQRPPDRVGRGSRRRLGLLPADPALGRRDRRHQRLIDASRPARRRARGARGRSRSTDTSTPTRSPRARTTSSGRPVPEFRVESGPDRDDDRGIRPPRP